ncbi:unnamed protein product [Mycena citricolor]|uniref:Uncharacterized protein n=1 Tax=Mycena citricolor TaxID=2018698 RepID=A0AAD2HKF8_9AGAR|nr:unnamed protein product [Mycena citricolor]
MYHTDIAKFLEPHSAEARAHTITSESPVDWDRVDEGMVALSASYLSFKRYLSREQLMIPPRTRRDLESVLRRYSTDAIHNAISQSRGTLQAGGYSRVCPMDVAHDYELIFSAQVCHLATDSIVAVLDRGDNVQHFLSLYASPYDG